jgi:hypothetical protein
VFSGKYLFVNETGMAVVEVRPKEGHLLCHLCGEQVNLKKTVHHVEHHIVIQRMYIHECLQQPVRADSHPNSKAADHVDSLRSEATHVAFVDAAIRAQLALPNHKEL